MITTIIRWASKTRDGWQLGEPPACPECGSACGPAVHDTGDGFDIRWRCFNDDCAAELDGDEYIIDWPFGMGEYATWGQLQDLGFVVVP